MYLFFTTTNPIGDCTSVSQSLALIQAKLKMLSTLTTISFSKSCIFNGPELDRIKPLGVFQIMHPSTASCVQFLKVSFKKCGREVNVL